MQRNPLFNKYRRKLIVEAVIKSLIIAADIAFGAAAVIAFSFWFSSINGTWYAVGTMLALLVGLTPVFYFLKYRPTDADIARRLDRLGLEERMITMTELEGDSSYLARRQAADAVKTLNSGAAAKGALAIAISGLMAIPLAATAVVGGGMITVSALSDAGVIRSGNEVLEDMFDPDDEQYVTVRYVTLGVSSDGGFFNIQEGVGMIEGNDEQIVALGAAATPVLAVGDEEWYFAGWNDGWTDPYREDLEIVADGKNSELDEEGHLVVTYTALFTPPGDPQPDPNGEPGDDGDPQDGDQPQDAPPEGDEKPEGDPQPGDQPGEGDDDEGGGVLNSDKDKVIDGDRDYHDAYDQYYEDAMNMLENGEDVPDYVKEIVKDYFGIII